jgi:diguanylate cyclase
MDIVGGAAPRPFSPFTMIFALHSIVGSISDVGLVAGLSIASRETLRMVADRTRRALCMGGLFGLAAWLSSSLHAAIPSTVLADNSTVFIGLSAAFFGKMGFSSAALLALALVWLGSGPPATEALLYAVSGLIGLSWSSLLVAPRRRTLLGLGGLGALLSSVVWVQHLVTVNFTAPVPVQTLLGASLLSVVLAILFGVLVERERDLIDSELRLKQLATTDELTGLNNRRALMAIFESSSDNLKGRALLVIDIDNFKSVNDAHGHDAGDKVIRHVADHLSASMRSGDVLCRYGGEEFAALLTAADENEAEAAAQRLRVGIEQNRVRLGQLALQVTVSIGLTWCTGKKDYKQSFGEADHALYLAKRSGRNRVVVAQTDFFASSPAE